MKEISEFFAHYECPAINGIFFPDGKVYVLNLNSGWDLGYQFEVTEIRASSEKKMNENLELGISYCGPNSIHSEPSQNVRVVCGEGSWGDDGFVAVSEHDSDHLIWLAFFTISNPFHQIKIVDNEVWAQSTLDCWWIFPLDAPERLRVQCPLQEP